MSPSLYGGSCNKTMPNSEEMKEAIQTVVKALMDNVMDKVLRSDPFIEEEHHARKPLYAALVPDEIFKGSHFERRFTTPFGKVWEQLAVVAATKGIGVAKLNHRISGMVGAESLRRIQETLDRLEHGRSGRNQDRIKPNWAAELDYVIAGGGELLPTEVIADVFVESTDGNEKLAFELKAPLPNSDQTKVSKEKLLKLYAMCPRVVSAAYFALPYNPYGKRHLYRWSFPMRWFDMHNDPVVLVGDEFWNRIGGVGTYDAFMSAINELGTHYKERIYRDYLKIDVPEASRSKGFRISEVVDSYDSDFQGIDSQTKLFDP